MPFLFILSFSAPDVCRIYNVLPVSIATSLKKFNWYGILTEEVFHFMKSEHMSNTKQSTSSRDSLISLISTLQPQEQATLARIIQRWQTRPFAQDTSFDALALLHQFLKLDPRFCDVDTTLLPQGPPVTSFREEQESNLIIPLPSPQTAPMASLHEIIQTRASCYEFSKQALTKVQLSTFLHYSYGVRGWIGAYGQERFPLRTTPSSGGLQTCDLYLITQQVEDLKQSMFYYHPEKHALLELIDYSKRPIRERLARSCAQPQIASAPLICIIVCDLERVTWKYGPRAYRFAHVDAGILAENMYLVTTGMGLHGCAISAFYDDLIHALLNLNGTTQFATLIFTIGFKANESEE